MFDDVPEPGLGVERNTQFFVAILRCERGVDHADTVTAAGIEAHRVLHQAGKARQFGGGPRHGADFASLGIDFGLVIQHHRHRQTFQPALLLLGVTDRTIQLEVAGRLLALVRWIRRQHRLAGGRIDDLRAIGVQQRLTCSDGRSRARCSGATGLLWGGRGAWWLIAQGARHALRTEAALTLLVNFLLTAQRRLVRVEHLRGGLHRAEIHIGRDLGLVATGAQHRLQNIVHALGKHPLHAPTVVVLFAGHAQLGVFRLIGEQLAFLIDHRHLRLVQFGHAGGHQIDDRHHLPSLQAATGIQLDQHRGGRLALVTHEHRAFRNRQVHTGRLDVVQAGNGSGQFAFEAATIAGGLHKLAGTQALLLIEDFKAQIAVARINAGGRQLQARPRQILGLYQQGAGVGLQGVSDVGSGQGFGDLIGIHPCQAAIQRPIIRLLRPQHHGKADGHTGGQAHEQTDLTQHRHVGEVFQKAQTKQRRLSVTAGGGWQIIQGSFGHDSISLLNRHLHDVLIGLNQLVAHLGHGLERHAGFLRRDHHVGQVNPALSHLKCAGQLAGGLLGFIHLADGLAEHIGETRRADFLRTGGRLGTGHRLRLHGAHFQHQAIEFDTLAHDLPPLAAFF